MKRYGKRALSIFLLIALVFTMNVAALAAQAPALAGVAVGESNVEMFLSGEGLPNLDAKISNWACEIAYSGSLEQAEIGCQTLFLIDSSTSMRESSRQQVKELLHALIEGKSEAEQYAIAAFGEEYRMLADFESDRYDLSKVVEGLSWEDEASSIYDAVRTAAQSLLGKRPDGLTFIQIVVLSDGVEDAQAGITREELFLELTRSPLPVHTVGFLYADNADELKNLYAISRVSGGFTFEADAETEIMGVSERLTGYLAGITYLDIILPEQAKDGAVRPLTLSAGEGTVLLQYDLHMPGTEQAELPAEPEPAPSEVSEPQPAPEPSQPSPSGQNRWLLPVVVVIAAVVAAAAVGIGVRSAKKKKQSATDAPECLPGVETEHVDMEGRTQFLIPEQQQGGRQGVWLILNDLAQPHRRFETIVEDTVEIGREPNGPGIAIDYDKKISKRHCSVTRRDMSLWVEDLGSTNKTFVNGDIVNTPRKLGDNDILSCGKSRFSIRIEKR